MYTHTVWFASSFSLLLSHALIAQEPPVVTATESALISDRQSPWSGLINPANIQSSVNTVVTAWSSPGPQGLHGFVSGGCSIGIGIGTTDGLVTVHGTCYSGYRELELSLSASREIEPMLAAGVRFGIQTLAANRTGSTVSPVCSIGMTVDVVGGGTFGACWRGTKQPDRAPQQALTFGWAFTLDEHSRLFGALYGSTTGESTATIAILITPVDAISIYAGASAPGGRCGVGASVVKGPIVFDIAVAAFGEIGRRVTFGVITPL